MIKLLKLKNDFKKSIIKGTGKAILLIDSKNFKLFKNEILKASIINYAYDAQSEGDRSQYVYDIIIKTNNEDFFIDQLSKKIKTLKVKHVNDWSNLHLDRLLMLFIKRGYNFFKDIIYYKFDSIYSKDNSSYNLFENLLLDIDGIKWVKFIFEIIGKKLLDDPEFVEDDYFYDEISEKYPSLLKELKNSENSNIYINKYLDKIDEYKKNISNNDYTNEISNYKYNDIKKIIDNNNSSSLNRLWIWGKKYAQKEDLFKFKSDLKDEDEINKIISYLKIFRSNKENILELNFLLKLYEIKNETLHELLIDILTNYTDQRIHKIAISNIKSGYLKYDSISLLERNFISEDLKLLEKILEKEKKEHLFHSAAHSVNNVLAKNQTKYSLKCLEIIYNKITCSICRNRAIEIMINNNNVPKYILTEAIYDSNIETREIIKKYDIGV